MQAGVHAHQPVSPLPVDLGNEFGAWSGKRRARRRDVDHFVGTAALDRVGDRNRRTRGTPRHAGAAGLAPAGRIENRAVESNAAVIGGSHARTAGSLVTIV